MVSLFFVGIAVATIRGGKGKPLKLCHTCRIHLYAIETQSLYNDTVVTSLPTELRVNVRCCTFKAGCKHALSRAGKSQAW